VSYATPQDLAERFGAAELAQLTDPLAGEVVDDAVVARALADADAEIDARLAPRYALPITPTPLVLVRIAADLARYFLWDQRASDAVRNRAQEARRLLDAVAAGDVALGAAVVSAPAPGSLTVLARTPARQFSGALLEQYSPGG